MEDNVVYTCLECQEVIEKDDNFCYKCGNLTARGYKELKNSENINNGIVEKQKIKITYKFIKHFYNYLCRFNFSKGNKYYKTSCLY